MRRVLALTVVTGLAVAGCTPTATFREPPPSAGGLRLVAYDSCTTALAELRAAARAAVGPFGFGGRPELLRGTGPQADSAAKGAIPPAAAPEHSGTNTAEAGVDEPDLVKTDGRRIVTLTGGYLRVTDAATRAVTGKVEVRGDELLLAGDRALVLDRSGWAQPGDRMADRQGYGSTLTLIDLAGATPRVTGSLTVDGSYVDARQIGARVTVVVRSTPRLTFRYDGASTDEGRVAANRAVIDAAPISSWLPRYTLTVDGRATEGSVDCGNVSRPASYSGAAMLSVYSLDLGAAALTDGQPLTVLANGQTVYSTADSLYVANDTRWRGWTRPPGKTATERTDLYRFDLSKPGRPAYLAAGSVPGTLLNQYSISDRDGIVRIATTNLTQSAVYLLKRDGGTLAEVGRLDGLGVGERIYAVRFVGPVGYVVTFRQTDPLYVLDLADPAHPRKAGELKINGYSAYLHPAGDGRLIGVGQDASEQGRRLGSQVSLFDVRNPAAPARLAVYQTTNGYSEAEYDPHAFLYWPKTNLLVVPLNQGAVALRVEAAVLTELARLDHFDLQVRRSLIIGDTLWTVSEGGLRATSATTFAPQSWVPFD